MPTHVVITRDKQASERAAAGAMYERKKGLEAARREMEPYSQYGRDSLERMNRLFADPSYIEELPGYQFKLQQGLKGTTAARSRTSIFSGETLKALTEYASGLASQEYQAEWNRLQEGIKTGGAASGTVAEIEAAKGEAGARYFDQKTAWIGAQRAFGGQIFGQWSGAFASATASYATGGGGGG